MTHLQSLLVDAGDIAIEHRIGFNLIYFMRCHPITNYFAGKRHVQALKKNRQLTSLPRRCFVYRLGPGLLSAPYAPITPAMSRPSDEA